jgi:hypothetical protein
VTDRDVSVLVELCEPSQRLHGLAGPPCTLFSGPIAGDFQPLEAEDGVLGIAFLCSPRSELIVAVAPLQNITTVSHY